MADDITVKIGAKDNASKTLDSIQKKADKLDEEKVELTVDAKVNRALGALDTVAAQAKKVQAAADALGAALGPELAGRMDLTKAIRDFQRMDLTLEDITVNADKLGGKLREIDEQNIGGKLSGGASQAKQGIDDVGKSADSSKSALANMIGNSAQDLGALGGIAGSTGVAIGQMAEFMADARAEGEGLGSIISNFATVAGPIAALSIGLQLVTTAIADHKKHQEEMAAAVQATTDAFDEGIGTLDDYKKAIEAAITSGTADAGDAFNKFIVEALDKSKQLDDVSGAFTTLGLNIQDVGPTLVDADKDFQKWAQGMLEGSGVSEEASKKIAKAIDNFSDVKDIQAVLGKENVDTSGMTEIITALNQVDAAVGKLDIEKSAREFLDKVVFGGGPAAQRAMTARQGVDSQTEALQRYVQATLEANKATADAGDVQKDFETKLADARQVWEDQKKAVEDAAKATDDYQKAINSADWKTSGLAGATAAMQEFSDAQFGAADAILDVESAIDDLGKTWKDNKIDFTKTKFAPDFSTEEGRKNQKALENLAKAVDEQLGPAFADAGGDFDTFNKNAERIVDQTLKPLIDEFHLSKTQVEALRKQMGLLPEDLEVKFKLSGDEEAKVKLGLLQSAISGLDKPTQMKIGAQIAAGDVQGAVKTAQDAFNDPKNQVNMPVAPVAPTPEQVAAVKDDLQDDINRTPGPDVPLGASVSPEVAADGVQQMQDYINKNPNPTVVVSLDTTEALRKIKALRDFIQQNYAGVIDLPPLDQGGTAGGIGGIAGERGPEIVNSRYLVTHPTYIPPGTRVTSRKRTEQILRVRGTRGLKRYDAGGVVPRSTSVTINAAVIGSTFDVMNAVNTAVRRAERLLPRHP